MYSQPRKHKTVTATFYESEEIPDEFFSLRNSVRDPLIPNSVAKNQFDGCVIFWSDVIKETEYEFSFVTREALDVYR